MSKLIVALEQIDEGAVNPGTGMYEQPIWKITLKVQDRDWETINLDIF